MGGRGPALSETGQRLIRGQCMTIAQPTRRRREARRGHRAIGAVDGTGAVMGMRARLVNREHRRGTGIRALKRRRPVVA